jgi:hypothetical protein
MSGRGVSGASDKTAVQGLARQREHKGFTVLEALLTLAIASTLIVLLVNASGTSFRNFAQTEDTLSSSRHAQLLLSYLKADLALADAPPHFDPTTSPNTGVLFPKHYVHLAHTVQRPSPLTLFAHTIQQAPAPLKQDDPLATPSTHPLTPVSIGRAARVQNAFAWVDTRPQEKDAPRHFQVSVRTGGTVSLVTYTFDPKELVVTRRGPEGQVTIGKGSMREFSATPYLEMLVPQRPEQPVELLKCWVEVHVAVQANQKADPIAKKTVELHTKLFPKHLNAIVRGLSPF